MARYEKLGQKSVRFMGVGSEEDSSMPQAVQGLPGKQLNLQPGSLRMISRIITRAPLNVTAGFVGRRLLATIIGVL